MPDGLVVGKRRKKLYSLGVGEESNPNICCLFLNVLEDSCRRRNPVVMGSHAALPNGPPIHLGRKMWTSHPILCQQDLLNSNPQNLSFPIPNTLFDYNTWGGAGEFFLRPRRLLQNEKHWKPWDLFVFHLSAGNVLNSLQSKYKSGDMS